MARAETGRFTVVAYAVFLCWVALSGGGSRFDGWNQPVVRLGAIALLAALTIRPGASNGRAFRPAFWFVAAVGAVIAAQLVPLPPALWARLPGHAPYLSAAIAAGEPQPWRPINLVPDRGWNALFALLVPCAALAAIARLRPSGRATLLTLWIAIVLASALIGLAQVSGGGDDPLRFYAAPPTGAAVGLFANRNHQSLLLCCGIVMLAVWAVDRQSARARLRAPIAAAATAFLILMIPTTGSRAGLMLGLPALTLAAVLGWPAVRATIGTVPRRRRPIVAVSVAIAFAALIAVALTFARAEAVRRLLAADPVDDARVRLLHPLLGVIRDFFPVGTGFGSFDPVYRGFEPFQNLALTVMNQAHDDYLQVVMEGGLPGLMLLVTFVAWWAWATVILWIRDHDGMVSYGRMGSALLLLMMLASIVDYPVRTPLMMVLAVQSAGWMLTALDRARSSFSRSASLPPAPLHL